MIHLRSKEEIKRLRESGRIVAEALQLGASLCEPGVQTADIDAEVEIFIRKQGGRPSFKGHSVGKTPFPASVCISIDEQVVHGIPGKRRLKPGNLVGLDVGVEKAGYYGDAALTVVVGVPTPEQERLMACTREALTLGIRAAVLGHRIGDISFAIQKCVEEAGYAVVRDLCGHGVGQSVWEQPQIPNYGRPRTGHRLKRGMILALEPMVNVGTWRVEIDQDDWTVMTKDNSLSAHFEHTIAVTDGEPEILTVCS